RRARTPVHTRAAGCRRCLARSPARDLPCGPSARHGGLPGAPRGDRSWSAIISAGKTVSHLGSDVLVIGAGGVSDALGRILSERIRTSLGQPVVIENVTGAGGSIGVARVARDARRSNADIECF